MMHVTLPFVDPKVLSLDAYLRLKDLAHGSDSVESGFSFLVSMNTIRGIKKDIDLEYWESDKRESLEVLSLFEELLESEYSGLVLVLHESEHDMVMKIEW